MSALRADDYLGELDFGIEYDGPLLANHQMDVRDLAPALLSLGNFFQSINRQLDPLAPDLQVNIRATEEGSFAVHLKLLYDNAVKVGESGPAVASDTLVGLVTAVGSVIKVIRKTGRSGKPTESQSGPETILVWDDGTEFRIPTNHFLLVRNSSVRQSLSDIVKPVRHNGIDLMRFVQDEEIIGEVDTEDYPAFASTDPVEGETLTTSEREIYLKILVSAWQVGRKWRFSDGFRSFWAAIEDERFNAALAQGDRFGANDTLRCRVIETQWRDSKDLHSEIRIVEVIDRLNQPQQPQLGD